MKLDTLDANILEHEGKPQETLQELLGWNLAPQSAETTRKKIRKYLKYKQEHILAEREPGEMEQTVIKADGSITTQRMLVLSETESQKPSFVMEKMGYDPLQWKLNWCKIKRGYWDTSMKLRKIDSYDKDGKAIYREVPEKRTNHTYKCEISVTPIQDVLTTDMITEIFNELEPPDLVKYEYSNSEGMLLELPIMDLHLGKLSWKEEIGHNYSLKIAERLFKGVITDILNQIVNYDIAVEKVIYFIGQDFFHMDTAKNTTTAGTPMDSDTRWPKMFSAGVDLTVWAVEQLRRIAPVECIYITSNHDRVLSYALAQTMSAWYRKCDDVSVDFSPTPRKYIKYGKNLIGASHGSDEGKRIETIMQAENPKDWGKTLFREWHLAHLHSEQVKEIPGVIIRNMSSITSLDNWHKERGYMAIRKAQALLYDKEKGKRLTIDSNVMA